MPAGDGSASARGGVRATDRGDSDGDDGGRSAARRASAAGDAGTGRAGDLRAGDLLARLGGIVRVWGAIGVGARRAHVAWPF